MDQSIAGSIRISESDYPFSYEKETERITVYLGTKAITIPDDSEIVIGQKYGMMTGGKILYKLSVPYAIILSPEQGKYAFLWIKKKNGGHAGFLLRALSIRKSTQRAYTQSL